MEDLESKLQELAKRMINAFKHYECFVFEKSELELVRELLKRLDLNKKLLMRRADPRYEDIYILLPWRLEFEQECLAEINRMRSEKRIDEDIYAKYYKVMILQCIKHHEREELKEVISTLEKYISMEKR
ncbi:MAG: hypothetical protein ABWW65_07525 [Thermoprotei archaeon]